MGEKSLLEKIFIPLLPRSATGPTSHIFFTSRRFSLWTRRSKKHKVELFEVSFLMLSSANLLHPLPAIYFSKLATAVRHLTHCLILLQIITAAPTALKPTLARSYGSAYGASGMVAASVGPCTQPIHLGSVALATPLLPSGSSINPGRTVDQAFLGTACAGDYLIRLYVYIWIIGPRL